MCYLKSKLSLSKNNNYTIQLIAGEKVDQFGQPLKRIKGFKQLMSDEGFSPNIYRYYDSQVILKVSKVFKSL